MAWLLTSVIQSEETVSAGTASRGRKKGKGRIRRKKITKDDLKQYKLSFKKKRKDDLEHWLEQDAFSWFEMIDQHEITCFYIFSLDCNICFLS